MCEPAAQHYVMRASNRSTKLAALMLLVGTAGSALSADPGPTKLVTTYAAADACQKFYAMYTSSDACQLNEDKCFVSWPDGGYSSELKKVPLQELAVNQYGYTRVYVARSAERPYALVYLDRFQGDRNARLLATWKVDAAHLRSLTERAPRPLPYKEWVKGGHGIERSTLAPEFASLLSEGEKISDDWSPVWMPYIQYKGADYAVTRECAGTWVYGGYYACNVVIKLTVKRIANDEKTIPVCEFARLKAAR